MKNKNMGADVGKKRSEEVVEQVQNTQAEQAASAVQVRDPLAAEDAQPEPARPRVDLPRVLHLLRRAALALNAQDPLAPQIRQSIDKVFTLAYMEVGANSPALNHLRTIVGVLALDPHAEAASRDVRAALELLEAPAQ